MGARGEEVEAGRREDEARHGTAVLSARGKRGLARRWLRGEGRGGRENGEERRGDKPR